MAFSFDVGPHFNIAGPNITSVAVTSVVVSAGASAVFAGLDWNNPTELTPSSVQWDVAGVDEALAPQITSAFEGTSDYQTAIYGRLAPKSGTLTMTATWSSQIARAFMGVMGVSGGSTSSLSKTTSENDGQSEGQNEPKIDITTQVNASVILANFGHRHDALSSPDVGTEFYDHDATDNDAHAGSYLEKATLGAQTMAWTLGTAPSDARWVATAIEYEILVPIQTLAPTQSQMNSGGMVGRVYI